MVNNSTDYYRENKTRKRVVHVCPHCDYYTTGPKISLKHLPILQIVIRTSADLKETQLFSRTER